MKPVTRQGRLIVILLVALIGGTIYYVQQTQPDLPHFTRLARRALVFDSAETHTWWLTEKELLIFRSASSGEPMFVRHNIDTSADTPLTALSALYRESAGRIESLRPSPTGEWALWTGKQNSTYVATLDGRRHYRIPETGPRCNVWNYSGTGWYALNLGYDVVAQATEHDLDDPIKMTHSMAIAFPFRNDPNLVDLDHITAKTDIQLIVPLWTSGKGNLDRADVVLTGFGPSPTAVQKMRSPAPYFNAGGTLVFSPQSNQMAWQLDILLPATRFWSDLGFGTASSHSVGFFVTNREGNNISYGYLNVDRKDSASHPTDLQFSPGGAYFSFVLRKALWIVPTK